jgi:transposase
LRVGWDTVGRIIARVTTDRLDERRLQGLVCIGVDEISYRRHHRYLTSVADHRSGAIVWCRAGRNSATLQAFFDELGPRKDSIRAVSIDMSGEYQRAIRDAIPAAEICCDVNPGSEWSGLRVGAFAPAVASAVERRGRCVRRPVGSARW